MECVLWAFFCKHEADLGENRLFRHRVCTESRVPRHSGRKRTESGMVIKGEYSLLRYQTAHRRGHRDLLAYRGTLRFHRRRHHQPERLQAHPLPGMPKGNQAENVVRLSPSCYNLFRYNTYRYLKVTPWEHLLHLKFS